MARLAREWANLKAVLWEHRWEVGVALFLTWLAAEAFALAVGGLWWQP